MTVTTPPAPVRPSSRLPRVASQLFPWSAPAGRRALRTAVILPLILAFTSKVVDNPQMATYAAFGTFANLVLASFSGSRRDKLVAHLGLGLVGSVLLTIGTVVSASTPVAGVVTLVVTFVVLLAGVAGPNAAAGGLAAMLAYVLSAASPGVTSMVPSRLEGWWLATVVAAIAVVATSPRAPGGQLQATAAASARALAAEAAAVATGSPDPALRRASIEAQDRLRTLWNASPYRPTGLARADLALGGLTELLEWVGIMLDDTVAERDQIGALGPTERALLRAAGDMLDAVAGMLLGAGGDVDFDRLELLRHESAAGVAHLSADGPAFVAALHASFHARTLAVAVRTVAADALVAAGRSTAHAMTRRRLAWVATSGSAPTGPSSSPASGPASGALSGSGPLPVAGSAPTGPASSPPWPAVADLLARHASIRSVWVRNSARGAVAVAAAVTIADLTNVQHGFWVVLGTLSVLRTTATATGGTAVRALLGTTLGFVVGAAVILAVGTDTTVLWIVLPVAVLIASYAPGVAPFAAGQAAFTAMLLVLYNLLLPVGWKVGVVRVEDIAVGCGISLVVGILFWPRGATAVVADDLQDAFATSARYLVDAAEHALGLGPDLGGHSGDGGLGGDPSRSGHRALLAGFRLEDALRAFLTEQGVKPVEKDDLWALVGAAQRLRLTATALADLPPPTTTGAAAGYIRDRARILGDWYAGVGDHIGVGVPERLVALAPPAPLDPSEGLTGHRRACQITVDEHLRHLHRHHADAIDPATRLRRAVQRAWWHPAAADG